MKLFKSGCLHQQCRAAKGTSTKPKMVKLVKARSLVKGKIPSSRSVSPSARSKKKMAQQPDDSSPGVAAVTDHMTKLQAAGSWDTDEMTYDKHHAGEQKKEGDGRPSLEDHHRGIFSVRLLHKQHKEKTHPLDWGYPGEMGKEEVDCFVSFSHFFGDDGGRILMGNDPLVKEL